MSTIEPEEMLGGRRIEGNSICRADEVNWLSWFSCMCIRERFFKLTSLLSWVSSTATPASTLPTVREKSMSSNEAQGKTSFVRPLAFFIVQTFCIGRLMVIS